MRAVVLSFFSAMILGLAGGYGWSVWTAPAPHHAKPPKAAFAPIPESPEALPAEQDKEWEARAGQPGTPVAAGSGPAVSDCPDAHQVAEQPRCTAVASTSPASSL